MAITLTSLHIQRIVKQIVDNMVGLHGDIRANALTWKAMAQAQNPSANAIKQFMTDASSSYSTRLEWLTTYRNTDPNWPAVKAMFIAMGGDMDEAVSMYTELKAVVDGLVAGLPNISTYANIINACNQITAAVQAPDSLWPE